MPVWTSPLTFPRALAVNSADGSVWISGRADHLAHFAADGSLLSDIPGIHPDSLSVNPADGSCWAAEVPRRRLVHLSATGAILFEIRGLLRPASVSVNPNDGSCWVSDNMGKQIVHLSADGQELWRGCFSDNSYPGQICVNSADSSVWVAAGSGVAHLSPTGEELFLGPILPGYPGFTSLAVDPTDGSCWAAYAGSSEWLDGFVVHFSPDGTELWHSTLDIFRTPTSVSVDPEDGSCWVAENGDVVHLTAQAEQLSRTRTYSPATAVACNPTDGTCWSIGRARATHYAPDGSIIWEGGGVLAVRGVSLNTSDGSCWVADGGTNISSRVVHLSAAGDDLWRSTSFSHPGSVAADSSDNSCWVCDGGNQQIVHLAPEGGELARLSGFNQPSSVSVNPSDHSCWVADSGNNSVVHLSGSGTELSRGTGFSYPQSVSANPADGSCWAADSNNNRLVHLDSNGDELWSGPAGHLHSVSVNPTDGSCWLATSDGTFGGVVHVSASGVELSRTSTGSAYFVAVNPGDGTCWALGYGGLIHLAGDGTKLSVTSLPTPYGFGLSPDPGDGSCWVAADTGEGGESFVIHYAVQPGPTAAFTALMEIGVVPLEVKGVAPLTIYFRDQSLGNPTSWQWDFGDGGTSTEQNPSHTYTTVGAFTVSLSITAGDGTDTVTKSGCVTVVPVPPAPSADFAASVTTGTPPLRVTFTNLSTNDPTSCEWNFGDGASMKEWNVSHSYTTPGTYTVTLVATNAGGSDTETKEHYVIVSFTDTPSGFWAQSAILACVDAGIVSGYDDGLYHPERQVTRDQMAVYIARALAGGDDNVPDFTETPTFPDVPEENWALDYIEYAVEQAVVTGYDDGYYHPEYEVTRDQMAVYVARALVAPTGEAALADYVPADPRNFPDVPDTFWAYKHIEYCVENGVVQGYEDGLYHPEIVVTRDQMAVYIARAFGLL